MEFVPATPPDRPNAPPSAGAPNGTAYAAGTLVVLGLFAAVTGATELLIAVIATAVIGLALMLARRGGGTDR